MIGSGVQGLGLGVVVLGRWLIAAMLALVIPASGWLVVTVAGASLEAQWLEAVEAEYGPIPPDQRDDVALRVLCADPAAAADIGGACNDIRIMGVLNVLNVIALVLSAGLLLVALGVVLVSRGHRGRMAALFRPALTLLLVGISALVVADGIIVVGALWEIMMAVGRIFPAVILVLALAVLGAVVGMLRGIAAMFRRRTVPAPGLVLERTDHPALFDEVDDIARTLGTEPPVAIVGGLEPNFFVVDADVAAFNRRFRGRVLYLSVALCRVFTRAELRAVVGHELGHFRGRDTAYSKAFAPVYAGSTASLQALSNDSGTVRDLVMLPARKLLEAFFVSFAESERTISRERELEADRAGAEAATPQALAASLLKLDKTATAWDEAFDGAVDAARAGVSVANVASAFQARALLAMAAPARTGGTRRVAHPFDTHPPTEARLESLGVDEATVSQAAADCSPDRPASDLFGDLPKLEAALSEALGADVSRRLTAAGVPVGRLGVLTAAAALDPGVRALIDLVRETRGESLDRPSRADETWVALTDLALEVPQSIDQMHLSVDPATVPSGKPYLVRGLAQRGSRGRLTLPAGARLRPVATNDPERRRVGMEIDQYVVLHGNGPVDVDAPESVAVLGVGLARAEYQVGGLLVVPESDPLAAPDGLLAQQVQYAIDMLYVRRGA